MERHLKIILFFLLSIILGMLAIFFYITQYYIPEQNTIQRKWHESVKKETSQKISAEKKKAKASSESKTTAQENVLAKKFDTNIQNRGFIGVAYAVKNGKTFLNKGYGFSNKSDGIRNTPNSLFPIGSIQKSITGTLAIKILSEKKISLDTKLSNYYPEVRGSSEVSIRSMLNMSSGLLFGRPRPEMLLSSQNLIGFVTDYLTFDQPGVYHYSPINFMLTAGIIEKITGESYEILFDKYISNKIGLRHTEFYEQALQNINHAIGYHQVDGLDYGEVDTFSELQYNYEFGTGDIFMSAADLYQFESAVAKRKILTPNEYQLLREPDNRTNYFAGIYQEQGYNYSHGIEGGNECVFVMSTDGQNGIVLFTNQMPEDESVEYAKSLYNQIQ